MSKWKYKHLTEEQFEEYQNYNKDELIASLKAKVAYRDDLIAKKKGSDALKDIRSDINDFRKKWKAENPELVEEIERLKECIKGIESERDAKIEDAIEEKKDLEGGFSDSIKGSEEHIDALLHVLRFHD